MLDDDKAFYLIPGSYSIELEACAHLHPRGGVLFSRDAYARLEPASLASRQAFLVARLSGQPEAEALAAAGL